MVASPERVGFWTWLLGLGVDVAARRAIDARLARIEEATAGIRRDHSLDALVEGIEDARAEGAAAMRGE